jgi:hypothetical protein
MLLCGNLSPNLTTGARLRCFRELGVEVEGVNIVPFVEGGGRISLALNQHMLRTPGAFAFNRALLETAERFAPNVIWLEKPTYVFPSTLRRLRARPGTVLVYHNTDDWNAKTRLHRLHWRFLLSTLDLYDLHITSNLHNLEEMREMGLSDVLHMELAANPSVRHPGELTPEERAELGAAAGFIGHWEPATERILSHLARGGVSLKIYGGGWKRADPEGPLREAIQHRKIPNEEYARAIVSFDINLGIVSKWNRNHTASRTFQIPALGGFLLHERNEVVTRYFAEGEEAEFFDSDDEALAKCLDYLEHPEKRARVAARGRQRCETSGYCESDRVREILPAIEQQLHSALRA